MRESARLFESVSNVPELAKPRGTLVLRALRDALAVQKYQNRYAKNSDGMLEFAHSSQTSIRRDIKNAHVITWG